MGEREGEGRRGETAGCRCPGSWWEWGVETRGWGLSFGGLNPPRGSFR